VTLDLDLFRLMVFVTVVDRRGYSAAARHLHLAQSTVSHHVKELERSCGSSLLRYEDRVVHLTPAGQEVYDTAVVMLAEQDHLAKSLGDIREGRRGRVRLGASMAFEQKYFFTDVVAPFYRQHPTTLLSLRFGHSRRQAQAVLDRELDLAYVIRWDLPGGADFEVLHQAELLFLVAPEHPLASQPSVTVDDIEKAGMIAAPLTGPETFYYREVFRERGITDSHDSLEVDGQQARLLATAAGLGVMATFIPSYARQTVFETLTPLPVEGPTVSVDLGLVTRPGERGSAPVAAMASWLRELAAS
jgi:DNA-binding transcriptional LysR family regulator